jgi:L-lactate dehydrogenase complex protein LldG
MSSSKSAILDAIRRNRPAGLNLPTVEGKWTTYSDRAKHFVEVLEAVGGAAIRARTPEDANDRVQRLSIFEQAQRVASLVPGIGNASVDLAAIVSPHALEDIDIAILPGEFAVAENAAVWVTDQNVPLRALFFICQHLVLVVPSSEIVDHLHDAYDRLVGVASRAARDQQHAPTDSAFAHPQFGAFISGPSKTADIEQNLVIGAHGPRSLTVCLLGE